MQCDMYLFTLESNTARPLKFIIVAIDFVLLSERILGLPSCLSTSEGITKLC